MPLPYIITSSILSADFACLSDQIAQAERGGIDWIHIDVMDGQFVPNLTMGPFIVETCRRITRLPLDVHLMIETPERLYADFARAGASLLYTHIETCPHIYRSIQHIHEVGCKAGVVLNPGTPAAAVEAVLPIVDVVLVMTVNPGFSGQEFLPGVITKIAQIRKILNDVNPQAMIAVDGGINGETLPLTLRAGAQIFIAATAIYKNPKGIAAGIHELRSLLPG
jgi:ribulose-phosphate 3-epimerase